MTISTTVNRASFTGNGVTTAFSFPYYFLANADLVVVERTIATGAEVTKTITTHYTVTGAGVQAGGTVTAVTAPAATVQWIIYRAPAITQAVDLVDNDPLPANESIEKPLDRLTMICQRLSDLISRSFRLTDGDTTVTSTVLPTPAASKLLGWDSAGTALANYATSTITATIIPSAFMETVLDDSSGAAVLTTIGGLAKAGGTMTGDITMTAASFVEAEGAAVVAVSSTNIWATDGNTVHVTGNTGIADFATAPQAGAWMKVIFDGTPTLTQSANLNLNAGGSNITIAADDFAMVYADTTTQMDVFVMRKSGASVGTIAASQTEMEAQSSSTVFATPANVKYAPGVAKAWASWTVSGGTPTLNTSQNIASITDNGVGDFTFTFTTAFSSVNYVAAGATKTNSVGSAVCVLAIAPVASNPTAGACRIVTNITTTNGANDCEQNSVAFFGDQ